VSPAPDDRRYIRAVEAAWSSLLGRPSVVSPREFETIDRWRRRGIPLSVVLEVIAAAGRRRSGKAPRALTALADAVEESWAVVAAGRTATAAAEPSPTRTDATRVFAAALARAPEGAPLHALLAELVADARAGAEPSVLDARLDRSLPGAVPGDVLERAAAETRRELAGFRDRMSEAEFGTMLVRAVCDRLRQSLDLPRLALFR
jgi:hypothetical protein